MHRSKRFVDRSAPFVPSGNPGNDRPWRRTVLARNCSTHDLPSKRKTKNCKSKVLHNDRLSEYENEYVEWDIPEREERRPQSTLGPIPAHDNVARWKSSTKSDYEDRHNARDYVNALERPPAGAVHVDDGDVQSSMDWKMPQSDPNPADYDPPSPRDTRLRSNGERDFGKRSTEHSRQYRWKQANERAVSSKPTRTTAPVVLDDPAANGPANWNSEYDRRCAELRQKQSELTSQLPAPAAGLTATAQQHLEPFGAWSGEEKAADYGKYHAAEDYGDEEPQPRQLAVRPTTFGYNRGTSEYKSKYIEWPMQETKAVRNNNTTESSYSDDHPAPDMPLAPAPVDRTVSVLKEDYPGYTVEQMARAQSPSGKKDDRSGQANPYSFAWPLVDGPATYSDVVEEPGTHKPEHPLNLTLYGQCSEYTDKYIPLPLPPHEEAAASGRHGYHNKTPSASAELHLFEAPTAGAGVLSEYEDKFRAFTAAATTAAQSIPAAGPRLEQHRQDYPPQFAWAIANGTWKPGDQSVNDKPRERRPLLPSQEQSEYTRRFPWPPQSDTAAGFRARPPAPTPDVIGIDTPDLDSSQWQSEYDAKCSELRLKQKIVAAAANNPSAATADDEPVAGVLLPKHPLAPSYFAWEEPAEARLPPTSSPPADMGERFGVDDHVHSEYTEKFVHWPVEDPSEKVLAGRRPSTLNLFAPESTPSVEMKSDGTGEREECAVKERQLLQSEYDAKYGPHSSFSRPDRVHAAPSSVPPQFAWPRVDPYRAPAPKAPRAEDTPAFEEESEYHQKFAWPQQNGADTSHCAIRPQSHPDDVIVPIPEKQNAPVLSGADKEKWMSEYDAHTADVFSPTPDDKCHQPPAGMPSHQPEKRPYYYAWKKGPTTETAGASVTSVPHYKGNHVESEYDDEFVAFDPNDVASARPDSCSPKHQPVSASVTGLDSTAGGVRPCSEYDDKFHAYTPEDLQRVPNPFDHHHHHDPVPHSSHSPPVSTVPPQFAWPLIDKDLPAPPATHKAKPKHFIGGPISSEYDSKFTWPPSAPSETLHSAPDHRTQSANPVIVQDAEDMKPSNWLSEYDDRCATLRQKQAELAMEQNAPQFDKKTAGRPYQERIEAPPFYAWPLIDGYPREQPPQPKLPAPGTEPHLSEYRDKFVFSPKKEDEVLPAPHAAHNRRFKETYNHLGFRPTAPFDGLSEYDDKFRCTSISVQRPHLHNQHYETHDIIGSTDIHEGLGSSKPSRLPTAPATVDRCGQSEHVTSYTWSREPRAVPKPVLSSHKSTLMIGANDPAGTTVSCIPKPGFQGETEFQCKYSWPERNGSAAALNVSAPAATKAATHTGPGLYKGKYRLMRNRFQSGSPPRGHSVSTIPRYGGVTDNFPRMPHPKQVGTMGTASRNLLPEQSPSSTDFAASNFMGSTSSTYALGNPDRAGVVGWHPDLQNTMRPDSGAASRNSGAVSGTRGRREAVDHFAMTADSLGGGAVSSCERSFSDTSAAIPRFTSSSRADDDTTRTTAGDSTVGASGTGPLATPPSASSTASDSRMSSKSAAPLVRASSPQQLHANAAGLLSGAGFRSRSTPPRIHRSVTSDSHPKMKMYVDETALNPVLRNKRYPYVSMKQLGRWTTETSDKFRWSRKAFNPSAGHSH